MKGRVSLDSSIMEEGVIGESIVGLCHLGGETIMEWGKMRVHYRKGVSLKVYIHEMEKIKETFVQRRSLFWTLKVSIPCFENIEENYFCKGKCLWKPPSWGWNDGQAGPGIGKWECCLENGFLGKVHLKRKTMGQYILVMEVGCPQKHHFSRLDVVGDSTVGKDCLERVHSEEVRRWESPLKKDFLGSIHSLREGNGRAHVKKRVSVLVG